LLKSSEMSAPPSAKWKDSTVVTSRNRSWLSHLANQEVEKVMSLTHVRQASYGVTAVLALTLLGTSCTAEPGAGPAATHITVGALPVVDNVGLYIAADEGIFKRVGLSVTIRQVVQSTKAIPEMQKGAISIIGGANDVSFMAVSAKAAKDPADPPFRLVMEAATCAPGTFDVLTLPDSGITKPADLAGKTIAVNLTGNVQTLTINSVLKADGVNPSSVRYVVVPFPEMIAALRAHRVNAISAVEPFATAAELTTGAEPVLDQCQGPTENFPLSGYWATATWVRQHPATVRAFVKAMAQAQTIADNDREVVEKTLLTYIPKLSKMEAAILALDTFPTSVDAIQLKRVSDLMYSGHLLSRPFDVHSILTK
jgi:NitT/TauT family transport system substrate-binding protein